MNKFFPYLFIYPLLFYSPTYVWSQSLNSNSEGKSEDSVAMDMIKKSQDFQSNNLDSALFYAQNAYDLRNRSKKPLPILLQYAVALTEKRELNLADEISNEALKMAEMTFDTLAMSKVLNTKGNIFFYKNEIESALEMYRKALEYERKAGKKTDYAKSIVNYAIILGNMARYEEQIASYKEALKIFLEEKDFPSALRTQVNISSGYGKSDVPYFNLDSAIYFGREAIKIAKHLNFPFGIAKAQSIVCSPLIRKGYLEDKFLVEGLEAARSAREFFEKTPYKIEFHLAYLNEGYAYEALGETSKAIRIAKELINSDFGMKQECYRLLYRAYKKNENYKESLIYHERYLKWNDSLNNLQLREKLNEIQTKYETAKKDKEIVELSQKAQIQLLELSQTRAYMFLAMAAVLILVLITTLFVFYRNWRHKAQVSDMEQKLLRLQMNPHFIFNALGSVQQVILKGDIKEAVSYLAKFAKLMRQILEQSRQDFIKLEEEIELVSNYLSIQQMRFNGNFDYQIKKEGFQNEEEIKLPPLFTQPFVENAIEHGLKGIESGGNVLVLFKYLTNKSIEVVVQDNGVGFSQKQILNPNHKSMATSITRERLTILEKRLKQNFSLKIQEVTEGKGTVASLILPLA